MPSDKYNSITVIAAALISHCSMSLGPETCLFANQSSSNVCIMVLPKFTFVPFVLHSFLPYRIGDDLRCVHYIRLQCETYVSAEQAGALLTLFFAWNISQTFKELEAKQSVMIHRVKATHPLYINNLGVCFDDSAFRIFRIMAGLIVEMLFMLFSVYNTA